MHNAEDEVLESMLFKWFWRDKSVTVPDDGSMTDKSQPFCSTLKDSELSVF
jgi:hypothetical protein